MQRMLALALGLTLIGAVPVVALAADEVIVETRNLYLGADLDPIIAAPDLPSAIAAILAALDDIAANNFPERAEALAQEIADKQPHLVGLQEVFDFTLNGQNGDPPFRNMLDDLLDALAAKGANYEVVASVRNIDIPIGLGPDLVRITDNDVILARGDVGSVFPVPFSAICGLVLPGPIELPGKPSADGGPGCNYSSVAVIPGTPIGDVTIERGFVGVDALVGGRAYRFVNTHLEVQNLFPPGPDPTFVPFGSVQAAQASELNGLIAASLLLLPFPGGVTPVVVGDINSSPDDPIFQDPVLAPGIDLTPPYMQFANGTDLLGLPAAPGPYADAWDLRPGKDPGYTCCELSDLSNNKTIDDERIDVIFSLEKPDHVKANVIGNEPSDKTSPSRLWPSDHAGVVGTLTFE